MGLNKKLAQQIKQYFPEADLDRDDFRDFIDAVNDTYNELLPGGKDKRLSKRETNDSDQRQKVATAIAEMKEAMFLLGGYPLDEISVEEDIVALAALLKKQVWEAKRKQRQQQELNEEILKSLPADITVLDRDGRYVYVNPSAVRDAAVRKWVIGKTEEECTHGASQTALPVVGKDRLEEVRRTRRSITWEDKTTGMAGEGQYKLKVLQPVVNAKGQPYLFINYGIDITERKKADDLIRQSELRYRSIFDNSQALICTHDLDGNLIELNQASVNTFGYDYDDLKGRSLATLLPKERQSDFNDVYLKEIKDKGKAEGIMVALSKTGERIYLLYQNFLVTDEGDQPYVIGFSQDITARIKAEQALKASEEKYRRIIENMNLGLLQVSPDERIVYANQSFCDMSGYTMKELIGNTTNSLFVTGEKVQAIVNVNERRQSGRSDAYELQVVDKQGNEKWWLISGAPIFDAENNFVGSIGIHLDITSHKKLEADLRKANEDAAGSARAKELFLANISHEIRTPMNAIIGLGRLLAKTKLDAQQEAYLDIVRNASDNLLVIINDLLDFTKIEAGKVMLEDIGFVVQDTVENTLRILRHKAEEKGISVRRVFDKHLAKVLIGDPYRLGQVIMNLLSNAIKFTDNGEVLVECTVLEDTDESQLVQFIVQDTGIGMSEEFVRHLFDKFTQENESITRRYGGTGLGMSICRQLVDLMGGDLKVSSRKGIGTSISFTLNFRKGSEEHLPKQHAFNIDTQVLKGKSILLVEDNSMNRVLANTILSQYGADVTEAHDGAMAIEVLRKGSFDLVLMDIQMPVMDGLEATRLIRAEVDRGIPIIALTAYANKHEEQKCLAAGMNDFISKPFDEDKMVQLVAQWLGRESRIKEKVTKAKQIKKASEALFDLGKVRAFSGGDEDFVVNLAGLFVVESVTGLEKMEGAFKENDWDEVAAMAHKIKPSMHTFGVTAVVAELEQIEALAKQRMAPEIIRPHIDAARKICTEVFASIKAQLKLQ